MEGGATGDATGDSGAAEAAEEAAATAPPPGQIASDTPTPPSRVSLSTLSCRVSPPEAAAAGGGGKAFARSAAWGGTLERESSYARWARKAKRRLGWLGLPFRCCKECAEGAAGCCARSTWHCLAGDARLPPEDEARSPPCPPQVIALLVCTFAFAAYHLSAEGWITEEVEVPPDAEEEDLDNATMEERRRRRRDSTTAAPSAALPSSLTVASEGSSVARTAGEALAQRKRVRCFLCGFRNAAVSDLISRCVPLVRVQPSDYLYFVHTVHNLRERIDTNALVLHNPSLKRVVVSFRGTSSAANLRTDLSCLKVGADNADGTKGPRIHEGFHEAYYKGGVAAELESMLTDIAISEPGTALYLTGHSLGGALATILAWRLARLALVPESTPIYVFTFGSPRVGDWAFASAFDRLPNVRCWRFVLGHDVVPRLPMINYCHAGHLVWLHHGKAKVYNSGVDAPWRHSCLCLNCDVGAHSVASERAPPGPVKSCLRGTAALWHGGQTGSEEGGEPDEGSSSVRSRFRGYLVALHQAQPWPDDACGWGGPSGDEFTGVQDCTRLFDNADVRRGRR